MKNRECPHPDCSRRIPHGMFACNVHWFQLPAQIRDLMWRAYRAFTRSPSVATGAELRKIQKQAVAWYQEQIDRAGGG